MVVTWPGIRLPARGLLLILRSTVPLRSSISTSRCALHASALTILSQLLKVPSSSKPILALFLMPSLNASSTNDGFLFPDLLTKYWCRSKLSVSPWIIAEILLTEIDSLTHFFKTTIEGYWKKALKVWTSGGGTSGISTLFWFRATFRNCTMSAYSLIFSS